MATLNIKNFPDRLYRSIKLRAGRNRRSISQEVVQILDDAVTVPPRVSLIELEELGKELWEKALGGRDASDHVGEERESWG